MKTLSLVLALAAGLCVTGCAGFATVPVSPAPGFIYTELKGPLDIDFEATTVCSEMGSAEAMNVLGLVALGDCSIATAATNGGLSTIHHADWELYNILGIFSRFTVHVYGN